MGTVSGGSAASAVRSVFLGLETSGFSTGLALIAGEALLFETMQDTAARHNETLLSLINEVLTSVRISNYEKKDAATGISIDYLAGICLTVGPGMFTSLRVGLSVAKGLALARQIPLKGVNTLLALSATVCQPRRAQFGQGPDSARPILALLDARKQELYAGLYLRERPLLPPVVISPNLLPKWLGQLLSKKQSSSELAIGKAASSLVVVGDGAKLAEPILHKAGIDFKVANITYPSAAVVARLGRQLLREEGPDNLQLLEPLYLRRTDAELKREGQKPNWLL